jgi:hypothetical protein
MYGDNHFWMGIGMGFFVPFFLTFLLTMGCKPPQKQNKNTIQEGDPPSGAEEDPDDQNDIAQESDDQLGLATNYNDIPDGDYKIASKKGFDHCLRGCLNFFKPTIFQVF